MVSIVARAEESWATDVTILPNRGCSRGGSRDHMRLGHVSWSNVAGKPRSLVLAAGSFLSINVMAIPFSAVETDRLVGSMCSTCRLQPVRISTVTAIHDTQPNQSRTRRKNILNDGIPEPLYCPL
jgi:hypothetical protein